MNQIIGKSKFPGWMWSDRTRANSVFGEAAENCSLPIQGIIAGYNRLLHSRNAICRRVHEIYGFDFSADFYRNNPMATLIKGLLELSYPIEIFTTNYDRVFEGIIDCNSLDIQGGWDQETGPRYVLNLSFWDESRVMSQGRLTKLHGSTNWRFVENEIHAFDGIPSRFEASDMAILYPGYKGKPNHFFDKLNNHFRRTASEADIAIFIGYSFRDSDINAAIQSNLSTERTQVILIDKSPKKNLPMTLGSKSGTRHKIMRQGFDEESARSCLNLLRSVEKE